MSEQGSKRTTNLGNRLQVEAQCWLEEYRTLSNGIEGHFTSMLHLVILNITALGTIGGLVLSNPESPERVWLALIIPILSPFIGFLVYFHSRRMSQLGHYINKKIAPRLRTLTETSEVIGWESHIRAEERKKNKFFRLFSISGINLLTSSLISFVTLGFTAQQTFETRFGWHIILLWSLGLVLTIMLVLAFVAERKFWFRDVPPWWKRAKEKKKKSNVQNI